MFFISGLARPYLTGPCFGLRPGPWGTKPTRSLPAAKAAASPNTGCKAPEILNTVLHKGHD